MAHDPDVCHPEYKRYFVVQEQSASAAAVRAKKPAKCWRRLMGQAMTTASALELVMGKLEARDGRPQIHEPGVDLNQCGCMSCLWSDAQKFSVQTRLLLGHLNYAFVRMEDKMRDAYAREDELLDQVDDLRDTLASVSAEQLVKSEKEQNKKAETPKKKKRAKSRKTKKETKGNNVAEETKLVPVFGEPPTSTGGAFAALDNSSSGDERFDPTQRTPVTTLGPVGMQTPMVVNPLAASMQWTKFDGNELLSCLHSWNLSARVGE